MTMGTGIAVAAIWALPVACALSKRVTGVGLSFSMIAALVATWVLASHG